MHGVRYIIWALLFSITWNLMLTRAVPPPLPVFLTAFACALIACWIVELPKVLRVDRGRSQNLSAMQNGHLNVLHGEGLAADVGYIGYFSQAPICDLNGLINGRVAALLTYQQALPSMRIQLLRLSFLFVSEAPDRLPR